MFEYFFSHPAVFWLILGIIFIIFETFLVPGVGFLFFGLASFSLGSLLAFSIIETPLFLIQLGYVALLTFVWGILLWKPFKKYLSRSNKEHFSNMIGEMAVVSSAILGKEQPGQIAWSGTVMSALLEKEATVNEISKGTAVYIVKVLGSTAIVSTISQNS